ncbi:hypothetical protein TeGR_g10582 [Tetraparma gracilis]|uniref:Leucine-rich repeat domain-containing protein n=1 Tax=Tetraparma gracilis TaxID=2962635 RepID=A0ABQ6MBQ7_9STRA|nr:hypothetical protein TeGR_g10582 [Tetraparma gracilis]
MSKAVVYTGADPTLEEEEEEEVVFGEWENDEDVVNVTVANELTEIKDYAFRGCKRLPNLSFLQDSAITTVGEWAFGISGIITLQGMERVRKIGNYAFQQCVDLRTIEGLGCEEMGEYCFAWCTLLQSMKGWPASMTYIPAGCFRDCADMTTVDCDLSRVTSIGRNAFQGCSSLLPPWLSAGSWDADPAAVLTYLKEKSRKERARPTFLFCLKHAQSNYYDRSGDPCGASRRIIMEFAGLFPA